MTVCTDDGSYGHHGFVTDILKKYLDSGEKIGLVVAAGPVPMMKFVSKMTEPYGVHTLVSLNSIMIDGTGMCGGCRVSVGGKNRFTCVDGLNSTAIRLISMNSPSAFPPTLTTKRSPGKSSNTNAKSGFTRGIEMADKKEKVPRQPMPEQPASVRRSNFEEVPQGYTEEVAKLEASRWPAMQKPQLRQGLPG